MGIVMKFKTCDVTVCLVLAEDNGHWECLNNQRILADRN